MARVAALSLVLACAACDRTVESAVIGDCVELSAPAQLHAPEGCPAPKWNIRLTNRCESPVSVADATIEPAASVEGEQLPRELKPGEAFHLVADVSQNSTLHATLTRPGEADAIFTREVAVDSQARAPHHEDHTFWPWPFDLLIVIDDSAAMAPHRETIVSLGRFIEHLDAEWRPARVAIATATPRDGRVGRLITGPDGAIALRGAETVRRVRRLLDSLSFRATEPARPLEAMRNALTGPDGRVASWIDPTRGLAVVIVSARDDPSREPVETFVAAFNDALKRKIVPDVPFGSVISVVLGEGDPFCSGTQRATGRLVDAAYSARGSWYSLCEPQLDLRLMRDFVIHDLDQRLEVCLAKPRDLSLPLTVRIDGRPAPENAEAALWSYPAQTNCITLDLWRVNASSIDGVQSVALDYTPRAACD